MHDFENEFFFEGCLPVEVIASRGPDTLRLRPDEAGRPRRPADRTPAVRGRAAAPGQPGRHHFSIVGFQTQLKWGEQKRVFQLIPGARAGRVRALRDDPPQHLRQRAHRALEPTFEARRRPGLFFAGQMSGVEGYVESAASGLLAGVAAAARVRGGGTPRLPAGHGARGARAVHLAQRPPALPADEHRLRAAAGALGADQGQGEAAPRLGRAGAPEPRGIRAARVARGRTRPRGLGRLGAAAAVEAARGAFLLHLAASATLRPTPSAPTATTSGSSSLHLRREVGREPRPQEVDPLLIRGFLSELHRAGVRKTSAARKLATLRTFFRFLCREGVLEREPGARAALAAGREARTGAPAGRADMAALLDVPGDGLAALRARAMLELLYGTGIRCAELVGLDLRQRRPRGARAARRSARAGRSGSCRSDDRPAPRSTPTSPRPGTISTGEALFVNARGTRITDRYVRMVVARRVRAVALHRTDQPAHAPAQLRDPPPGARRRPAFDPGAAGSREPLHDPTLYPREPYTHYWKSTEKLIRGPR